MKQNANVSLYFLRKIQHKKGCYKGVMLLLGNPSKSSIIFVPQSQQACRGTSVNPTADSVMYERFHNRKDVDKTIFCLRWKLPYYTEVNFNQTTGGPFQYTGAILPVKEIPS